MTVFTIDNVRVLSMEAVKHPHPQMGECLKVRIALVPAPNTTDPEGVLLETTRYIRRADYDEKDAVAIARHWFLKLCQLGVDTMEPTALSDDEAKALRKPA